MLTIGITDSGMSNWKDVAEIVQGFAIALAALLGAAWTIYLFLRHREKEPRTTIEHDVDITRLGEDHILVRLEVVIRNIGKVEIKIDNGKATIQQLDPCDALSNLLDQKGERYPEREWPELDVRAKENWQLEIEPGESEYLHFDFVIPAYVKKVILDSYFTNEKKKGKDIPIGWGKNSTHLLTGIDDDSHPTATN